MVQRDRETTADLERRISVPPEICPSSLFHIRSPQVIRCQLDSVHINSSLDGAENNDNTSTCRFEKDCFKLDHKIYLDTPNDDTSRLLWTPRGHGSFKSAIFRGDAQGASHGFTERCATHHSPKRALISRQSSGRPLACLKSIALTKLSLSRPSLAEQSPLPLEDARCTASLAYPSIYSDHVFALSPLVRIYSAS